MHGVRVGYLDGVGGGEGEGEHIGTHSYVCIPHVKGVHVLSLFLSVPHVV